MARPRRRASNPSRFLFAKSRRGPAEAALRAANAKFERRFRQDFLPWLAKYDAQYHLGTTPEAAAQTYERLRAAMVSQS